MTALFKQTPEKPTAYPVVAADTFILATRETGYRSTAAAVAELIDNSLQAHASRVDVCVHAHRENRGIGIAVLDDGDGMSPENIQRALQFGGSERFNSREGFGRFGMGLPNSSLSQAPRVEVYSWRRDSPPHFTFLDVDDIAKGRCESVPRATAAALPEWAARRAGKSGTLVVWPRCDRLGYRRISTVSAKLGRELGRIYRFSLWQGVRITVNGDNVEPIDPLLCRNPSRMSGAEPVGDPLRYEIRAPGNPAVASVISVRFSLLPVAAWAQRSNPEKQLLGITGRAGVSVVRAGREIDYGWYLMGQKRKENYDDWWRCEIAFDPELDEYFRVTHSKQGVFPHPKLVEMIGPDLEQMARLLNMRVRSEFRRISAGAGGSQFSVQTLKRKRREPSLPKMRAPLNATRREQLLPPLRRSVRRYILRTAALSSSRFFTVEQEGDTAVVTLNSDHPFHEFVYRPESENGQQDQFRLECIVLAAARAELAQRGSRALTDDYVEAWSDALAVFLKAR